MPVPSNHPSHRPLLHEQRARELARQYAEAIVDQLDALDAMTQEQRDAAGENLDAIRLAHRNLGYAISRPHHVRELPPGILRQPLAYPSA